MNACCTYDFSISCDKDERTPAELILWLTKLCKKYCFQKEKGESGYVHYQGRVSMKTKIRLDRLCSVEPIKGKWSVTSNANRDNDFYVVKDDTRIEGPWKDTDEATYVPIQYRIKKLWSWQEKIIELKETR